MSKEVAKPEKRSRFRKIEVRMWGDQKFCDLSPLPPCGQGLWVFLLTGPHTGPIPGLFRAGRAAMAEELNWDQEAFDEAFQEALSKGMVEADWKAKVVWIPNAISCNRPESPNVVKSWASEWDLIPECALKHKAYHALRASIHALGESFGKAFDEAFVEPSFKPSSKPSGKTCLNQEQEQEQNIKNPPNPPDGGESPKSEKPKRERKPRTTLKTFVNACSSAGEKPISGYEPLLEYVQATGLPMDFVQLAWEVFKGEFLPGGSNENRLQADWRRHFLNYVKKGYYRLWFARQNGDAVEYALSTQGLQAQAAFSSRQEAA